MFAMAVLFVTVAIINCFLPADRAISRGLFGHDFLAFYSAGKLVNEGHSDQIYSLHTLASVQQEVASQAGLEMSAEVAPYWNPPHVALLFAPITDWSFGTALAMWTAISLACLGLSAVLLSAIVREQSQLKSHGLLVLAALFLAPATIQALGHGQNTPLSLLLLTLTVFAWRAREPLWAGLCCALLFYKPQLAAIVFIALSLTLGWRVWIGALVGGVPQLLLTVTKLPGAISDFLYQVPRNLEQIQFGQPYLWHRHSTLNGFFRFVLQGNAPGETALWITALSALCAILVGVAVLGVWWRQRGEMGDDVVLDRYIALVILSMPLLMPFYFDYDLLLLTVAGVLVARERLEYTDVTSPTRWLVLTGTCLYVWTLLNPPLAEATGISLTVPLLCIVVALQAKRCLTMPQDEESLPLTIETQERLAA